MVSPAIDESLTLLKIVPGYLNVAKRVIAADIPTPHQNQPKRQKFATVIERISASERKIKPLIIFKAGTD